MNWFITILWFLILIATYLVAQALLKKSDLY